MRKKLEAKELLKKTYGAFFRPCPKQHQAATNQSDAGRSNKGTKYFRWQGPDSEKTMLGGKSAGEVLVEHVIRYLAAQKARLSSSSSNNKRKKKSDSAEFELHVVVPFQKLVHDEYPDKVMTAKNLQRRYQIITAEAEKSMLSTTEQRELKDLSDQELTARLNQASERIYRPPPKQRFVKIPLAVAAEAYSSVPRPAKQPPSAAKAAAVMPTAAVAAKKAAAAVGTAVAAAAPKKVTPKPQAKKAEKEQGKTNTQQAKKGSEKEDEKDAKKQTGQGKGKQGNGGGDKKPQGGSGSKKR